MARMSAGQAVVEVLRAEGVRYVFGLVGSAFLEIMDAQMPNIDGIEATRLIKKEFPNIGVLFFSTYSDYRDDALVAGADGYLVKDCEVQELLDKVRQIAAANSGTKETKDQGAYQ